MKSKKGSSHNLILAFSLLFIVLGLWILSWIVIPRFLFTWNDRGTFGDMFGAINSLFSGLAFAGLIYTIHLQLKELGLQRDELEQTRAELEGQKLQLEKQNDNISKQNFEITFFNMLKNIQSITNYMVSPNGNEEGRIYLHNLFETLDIAVSQNKEYQAVKFVGDDNNKDLLRDSLLKTYDNIFISHSYNLGHFYRTIHNLLKMIENYSSDIDVKRKYSSILQAQLSNDELGFILYNSLSSFSLNKENNPEFHRMVDELNILENINEKCVFDKKLVEYFPNTNFFFMRKKVV